MSYKTTDALMQHLCDSGITINGEKQKRQLINTGYFHGYKGYRFSEMPKNDCLSFHIMKFTQQFNMTPI